MTVHAVYYWSLIKTNTKITTHRHNFSNFRHDLIFGMTRELVVFLDDIFHGKFDLSSKRLRSSQFRGYFRCGCEFRSVGLKRFEKNLIFLYMGVAVEKSRFVSDPRARSCEYSISSYANRCFSIFQVISYVVVQMAILFDTDVWLFSEYFHE